MGLGLRTGARTNKKATHIKLLLPDANLVSISRNSTYSSSTVYPNAHGGVRSHPVRHYAETRNVWD